MRPIHLLPKHKFECKEHTNKYETKFYKLNFFKSNLFMQ